MIDRSINIEFYQKPKICKNIFHKIDFLNKDDMFNPFFEKNLYMSLNLILDENIYDAIIDMMICYDFIKNKKEELHKIKNIENLLIEYFKKTMINNGVEFKKSSKYLIQSCFSKISFATSNSYISMYFQMIGKKHRKYVDLIDVIFLKHYVKYL